ncbi:Brain protein I3 [Orchesella cincta]|uniref:Membrane protein BRI3 n=1 Tax=Orchesella cincta TaxID=48709 RepID=A0A1D2MQX9_ORCCI|nr:Brain protein I3 [Orchesella cincta]
MDQDPRSPPPPYAPSSEYGKPPPYFEQPSRTESTVLVGAPPPPGQAGVWQPTITPGQPGVYQPNWQPPSQHAYPQQQQPARPTVITVHTSPAYQPQQGTVLVMGNCPSCRVGNLQNQFDICGVLIAILFFPIGILCCLCMMERRCSHCRARF